MLKKDTFAPRPPMGWNSWDCYGAAVNEEQLLGNAEYIRDNLKDYGWEYVVCDIQWYEPKATSNFYNNFTELCMDEYSRLIPAVNRFPSTANGVGFKAIADKIHAMGLKFGIHIMRGIPRQAVHQNTPIKVGNVWVGDMDGDGDIDDFDAYVQEWGDYMEMNNDGILTKEDVLYGGEMSASMWNTILEQYRKQYNNK